MLTENPRINTPFRDVPSDRNERAIRSSPIVQYNEHYFLHGRANNYILRLFLSPSSIEIRQTLVTKPGMYKPTTDSIPTSNCWAYGC